MQELDLLIRGANIVSSNAIQRADVGIIGKKIFCIGPDLKNPAKSTIDASGKHIFPGIIDTQVHFREPGMTHKEDLNTGSRSAVLGGVTTFLEMPNTKPPCTSVEDVQEKIELGLKKSFANFGFFIGATGENLDELVKSQDMIGCPGIKIFLGSSTGSLLLYERSKLLEIFKTVTCPVAVHSENEDMLKERMDIFKNATSVHDHYKWRNTEVAMSSTERVISIAEEAKKKIHVLHITTKDEMEFLATKKEFCTVETTPQHLSLSAPEIYDEIGTYAQMNPPIRTKEHTTGIWAGLHNGTVDVLGSDHAPHSKEEKDKGYPYSPSGMPGVQTIFPIMLDHALNNKLSIGKLCELLCETPSKLYSLRTKGFIKENFDADLTIVDFEKTNIIKDEDMASKCGWTPFNNKKVKGLISQTIVMGQVVVNDGKIISSPCGEPIRREQ